jgi:hypothetical protein
MDKVIRKPAATHEPERVSLGELIHEHVRLAIETAVHEELRAVLGAGSYERSEGRLKEAPLSKSAVSRVVATLKDELAT